MLVCRRTHTHSILEDQGVSFSPWIVQNIHQITLPILFIHKLQFSFFCVCLILCSTALLCLFRISNYCFILIYIYSPTIFILPSSGIPVIAFPFFPFVKERSTSLLPRFMHKGIVYFTSLFPEVSIDL
jgi:hypothetical protein